MSSIRPLPPSADLVEEVATILRSDSSDYSRSLVVFPGKRPAHFLRKKLAGFANKSIIPPHIFSIDNFVEFLFREKLNRRDRLIEPLDAVAVLHDIHSAAGHKFGGEHFLKLDKFFPLGMKIFAELEELKIACVPLSVVREKISGISFGQVQSLAQLYQQLYAALAQRNFVTRAMEYDAVAAESRSLQLDEYDRIVIAGFFALTTSEQLLFRELLHRDNGVYVYQKGRGIEKHLRLLGIETEEASHERTMPDVTMYRSPDAHGQVFSLSGVIHELLKAPAGQPQAVTLDEKTVIVLTTSGALFPVVNHVLPLIDQYNISHSYPIIRTPIYGFFSSLMNVIETMDAGKYYAPAYIKFVLHPYTKNIRCNKRADATRVLFHSIEEYFVERKSETFFSLDELEQEPSIYEAVQKIDESFSRNVMEAHLRSIHDALLRSFLHFTSLSDFALKSIDVLEYIDRSSTANLHPLFRPFAVRFIESLDVLRSSLLNEHCFDESASYFTFIKHYLSTVEVPFTGTPLHGVQVLGQLETRSVKFDRVFVLDVNDDVIPRSKSQDMLLPQQVRRALHLPTYRDREEMISYYFDTLLSGAQEVHLFFIENGQKERSRLIEKLLWEKQKKLRSANDSELIRTIKYDVSLSNDVPKPIGKTSGVVSFLKDFSFSATALDTYLHCQLQFYYRYVLRLAEKENVSGDVEQSDVGIVVHKALAEFFRPWRGSVLTENELRWEDLEPILDRNFSERFGDDVIGAAFLLRDQMKKQMHSFLENYQLPLIRREKNTLVDVEKKLEVEKEGVRFRGTLDRIEMRGDQLVILDYKTGGKSSHLRIQPGKLDAADRESWEKSIGSLQLPLYILMYAVQSNTGVDEVSASYIVLGNHILDAGCEEPLFQEAQLAHAEYSKIEEIIFLLVDEIQDSAKPFVPAKKLQDNCPRCPYSAICGTSWIKKWSAD